MTDDVFKQGDGLRRQVLGDDYVDKTKHNADEFSMPWQEFVTEHVWGAVWGRPGLELKTRSIINIAMLAATGNEHELKLHLTGALRNGVTKEEIREILIQVGAYAGAPRAVSAFKAARDVFAQGS